MWSFPAFGSTRLQGKVALGNLIRHQQPWRLQSSSRRGTEVHVDVYRKPTHTDCYLDFFSCDPLCHKRSVVNTLLKSANNIPSTNEGRREETQRVKAVLRDDNYPMFFYSKLWQGVNQTPRREQLQWLCSAAVCTGRFRENRSHFETTKGQGQVAYKPQQTINSLFPRPKELDDSDRKKSGIVYKINCTQCNFVYYGQTERSLKTRIAEHKKAVASFDQNSKVASHVHQFSHNMNFVNVKVVGVESN